MESKVDAWNILDLFTIEQVETLVNNQQQFGDILDVIENSGNVGITINADGGRINNITKAQRTIYQ